MLDTLNLILRCLVLTIILNLKFILIRKTTVTFHCILLDTFANKFKATVIFMKLTSLPLMQP